MKNKLLVKGSLIRQIAVLFLISTLLIGLLTFVTQRFRAEASVKSQTEGFAKAISEEVVLAIRQYPAYDWLLSYWHNNAETMDIEYDSDYSEGTATEEKYRLLNDRYPNIPLQYATKQDIESMSPEDQKLYAEVTYSWLINRIDQIKETYNISFLFCVISDEAYSGQFFLLSAATSDEVRGTDYEEIYPIGIRVTVSESQQEAMKMAHQDSSHLADAGNYLDYYTFLGSVDGYPAFIGMTYDLSSINSSIVWQTARGTALAILMQIILATLCLLLIYWFVIKPLKKVLKNIQLYKWTKDSQAVKNNLSDVDPHNEIGQLSKDFVGLSEEMDDYLEKIEHITAEKERIGTELELATRIQMDMLPNIYPAFPNRPEFDIYAFMEPAKEVGGDFYDYFLIDEDHLGLVMADVSGKGIPAALFMMVSKIILQNNAMMGKSPAQVLHDANVTICSNNREEMFVTAWLGILEISSGKLTASNAGHEYPVVKNPDEGFELLKDPHGLVIGAMDGISYQEYEIQLKSGSKLFLYTDGVPEATNDQKEMFGTDRMVLALNRNSSAASIDLVKNVRADVLEFENNAEQFDDLTMLCLEYKGKSTN